MRKNLIIALALTLMNAVTTQQSFVENESAQNATRNRTRSAKFDNLFWGSSSNVTAIGFTKDNPSDFSQGRALTEVKPIQNQTALVITTTQRPTSVTKKTRSNDSNLSNTSDVRELEHSGNYLTSSLTA